MLEFDKITFPVVLKNKLDTWKVIRGTWIPPNGTSSMSRVSFQQSLDDIISCLELNQIEIIGQEEAKQQQEEEDNTQTNEPENTTEPEDNVSDDVSDDDEDFSIVDLFVGKKMHWQAAKKEIEQISDVELLDQLYEDTLFHDLSEDSVIVKTIKTRLEELS